MFELGVEFSTYQQNDYRNPGPHHESDNRAQGPIGRIVVREILQVERESQEAASQTKVASAAPTESYRHFAFSRPLMPEIHEFAPHAVYVAREGEVNAWDNEDFVKTVRATGRKTLIMSGLWTSVCVAIPALDAKLAGFKVYVVMDASGDVSEMANRGRHCNAWPKPVLSL
jgi:nicotinamidase-related amidase